jgi:hypothetical protein
MEKQRIHIIGMPISMDALRLTTPTVVQNGNSHFTRILFDDSPLYFQTPRCDTKQGIVTTTTKKTYYDLILDSNSETSHTPKEFTAFVEWIQALEDTIVKLLHTNGKLWFRDPLSEDDIRGLFTSPLKPLKGGSQLSLRINIPTSVTRALQYACTVFDENEKLVHLNYITPEHQLISIIEVLGVRFTSSSFHLDLASKQIAVVTNQPLFQTCIIKKDIELLDTQSDTPVVKKKNQLLQNPGSYHTTSETSSKLHVEVEGVKSLTDADIKITSDGKEEDTVRIHDPMQVYYSLYKAALKRAREAKRESIQAFLDAKNIKNTYNLDIYDHEVSDDDDDDGDEHAHDHDNTPFSDDDLETDTVSTNSCDDDERDESDASETLGKPPIRILGNQNVTIQVEEILS